MGNVLIVAGLFPPIGGSGILRTLKFTKFLSRFGWRPVVLTVRPECVGKLIEYEASMISDFSKTGKVIRTAMFNPARFYQQLFNWKRRGQSAEGKILPNVPYSPTVASIKRRIRSLLLIPDTFSGWLPFGVWRGIRAVKEENIDVIFSTSDPYTGHLMAFILSKLSGKPWIADFRDPWTQDPLYEYRGMFRERIDNYLERKILESAKRVIVTTDLTRSGFLDKYPGLFPDKILTITNGFDPDDFYKEEKPAASDEFTIFYSGRFYGARGSRDFFKALRAFIDKRPGLGSKIKAHFVGVFDGSTMKIVKNLALENVVTYWGYVPRKDYLKRLLTADAFLLTFDTDGSKDVRILGKVFEYLASKKPILAVVPEGENANVIRRTKSGVIVNPGNINGIEEALETIYEQSHDKGSLDLDESMLKQYSREYLTSRLSGVFDEVTGNVKPRGEK